MTLKIGILLTLLYFSSVLSAPQSTTESLVVITDASPKDSKNDKEPNKSDEPLLKVPKIYSMRVDTNVTNRFATTLITSKVKNLAENSQEAIFEVVLPETAYISGFIMEIDGKKYEAYVQEKEEAKKTYDNAVASGIGAGHVAVSARDSNRFTVSVNIEPQSKATFYLKYEELLKREKGQYDIVINLHPGQPVKDLEVQVNINETRPLSFVKVPSLRSGNEISKNEENLDPKAEIENISKSSAKVTFKPDIESQKQFAKNLGTKEDDGLAGQFVVQYDVERDPQGGEILVSDGYFVHFFAPSELKPLPKHLVFVLDTSGSMWGNRIVQLKQAMKSILDQVHKEDTINIIDFNSDVKVWNIPRAEVQYLKEEEYYWRQTTPNPEKKSNQTFPGSYEVSAEIVQKAKEVVDLLHPSGGTNMDAAFDIALKLLKTTKTTDERQPIIMFLTDGQPTEGESDTEKLTAKVSKENTDQIPIFSLSFGEGADRSFLEKLSLKNQGFARHIYEGADAALQLESFYKYISSPLLTKINFKYVSESVSRVSKTNFPILFDGAEIVVTGRYPIPSVPSTSVIDPGFAPVVECFGPLRPIQFRPTFSNPIGSLEKHWAYLSLKQILDERDIADNKTELTKKALDIALKYSFVTPVSSLVVVKPNDTKAETGLEDASKSSSQNKRLYLNAPPPRFSGSPGVAGIPGPSGIYAIRSSFDYQDSGFGGGIQPLSLPEAYFDRPVPVPSARPIPITTPFALPTTEVQPTTEKSIPQILETYNVLVKDLTWLKNIFNSGNGTLTLPQGEYILDSVTPITDKPECPKTPLNGTGKCVLLKDCPTVHKLLTDLPTYSQYFCPLNGYAGICCPSQTSVTGA